MSHIWKHQVSVPDEYFSKAKKEYNNWRWAFVRELIQNSYDAGATKINFHLLKNADGDCVIECVDNGSGMDRETLLTALLSLGGSKKPEGSVGGFGWAKNLLFFAHKSYHIWTKGFQVDGKGGHYDLEEAHRINPQGTSIIVVMDEHSADTAIYESFAKILRHYVVCINTERDLQIILNGEKIESASTAFKYLTDNALGVLKFNDSETRIIDLIITVNGLPMFRHCESTEERGMIGVLELKDVSYEVLTSNRENFRGDLRENFSELIRKLGTDRFSMKRKPLVHLGFNAEDETLKSMSDHTIVNIDFPRNFLVRIAIPNAGSTANKSPVGPAIDVSTKLMKKLWVSHLSWAWRAYVLSVLSTDYAQEKMNLTGSFYPGSSSSLDIQYIIDSLTNTNLTLLNGAGSKIFIGFIFDPEIEGLCCLYSELPLIAIMVNPSTFDQKFWHGDVLDLALHECAHLIAGTHGDTFVEVESRLRRAHRRQFKEVALREAVKLFLKLF